jgi:hypothetical protein
MNELTYYGLISCLHGSSEYRRCLALLEQKGMLSASKLLNISSLVRPDTDDPKHHSILKHDDRFHEINCSLSAVLLAAQSLVKLEQYEDCLILLEILIMAENESQIDIIVERSHLLANVLDNNEGVTSASRNIVNANYQTQRFNRMSGNYYYYYYYCSMNRL